ncbi:hypothetical protein, partial [Nostoc flagelliforme]|uniref:hypothetical protein n=1 Tax=Nostoc flagelliforme TaxID=1306274 RepID=UPI001F54D574
MFKLVYIREIAQNIRLKSSPRLRFLVESMGSIISRTSQLEPDVPLSRHPAPDILSFRFCPCV